MNIEKTARGFSLIKFEDAYGISCSLQKSSLASEDAIWFGCDDANPREMIPGQGWFPIDMPNGYAANTRMHLTQDQVRELLPVLQNFAATGELSEPAPAAPAQPVPETAAKDSPAIKDERLFEIVSLMNEAWSLDDGGMCARTAFEELCEFIDARVARLATPIAQPVAAPVVREPLTWVSVEAKLPEAIDVDDGSYPCNPIDSVICAIWRGTWLQAWAKQRYCADGQWRQNDAIGFTPTHWMPLPPAPTGASHE